MLQKSYSRNPKNYCSVTVAKEDNAETRLAQLESPMQLGTARFPGDMKKCCFDDHPHTMEYNISFVQCAQNSYDCGLERGNVDLQTARNSVLPLVLRYAWHYIRHHVSVIRYI